MVDAIIRPDSMAPESAPALQAALDEVAQLKGALERRTVIGQALGRLMERYALNSDAAFALLSRVSQQRNRKLYDLAVELATTGHVDGL